MKTIDQLLQQAYQQPDSTQVTLKVETTLGLLRQQHQQFRAMNATPLADGARAHGKGKSPPAPKRSKRSGSPPRRATRQTPRRAPATVTMAAVKQALRDGHTRPVTIAQALNASTKAVANALGRYLKQGEVVRTQPGHYGLTNP